MFTRSLPMHGVGGMEVVAWDLAQSLSRLGCDLEIITTEAKTFKGKQVINGVPIHFIEGVRSGKYSREWWERSKEVFDLNYKDKCDCVFSVSTGAYGLLRDKASYNDIDFVIQIHGTAWGELISKLKSRTIKGYLTWPKNLSWMFKDLVNYKKFDKIISIGKQVSDDLSKWPYKKIIDPAKHIMIKNGIDHILFSPNEAIKNEILEKYKIPSHKKIIVTACRLHEQKGVLNCLRTLEKIKNDLKFFYIIVGSGPQESYLKKVTKELGLTDKVLFTGSLSRPQIAQLESACDLFLFLTDRVEGLPLNVLEASSVGLDIVISEQVKLFDSVRITSVNPKDYEKNAKIIVEKLSEKESLTDSYLPSEYTLDYTAEKYLETICQINEEQK